MGKPDEAAHLLGKLLVHLGEDRILWGTDSIWYGSPQDQIQAFRAFEITPEFQERFGYPALTDERKAKILGLNAARLHGIEPVTVACPFTREQLQQAREDAALPFRTYGPRTAARAAGADLVAHRPRLRARPTVSRWGRRTRGRYRAPAMPRTGRDVLLEVLRTEGVRHVFGNPGSHRAAADRRPRRRRRHRTTCSPCRRRPRSAWPTATPRPPGGRRSSTSTPRPGSATPSATSPTPRPTARRSS